MLSEQTKEIVKQTVPVLEQYGNEITKVFYQRMFEAHPELLNIFNKSNQKQGKQQTALAQTVLAAAKHIDHLEVIVPNVNQIAHKHRALQVKEEHYPIVGEFLLKAIKEVLGDAATDDIMNAWEEAYGEIAGVFIQMEKSMYEAAAWDDFKSFKIANIEDQGTSMKSFEVEPVNNIKIPELVAGQYITVRIKPTNDDNLALRHYSIYSVKNDGKIRFAVKREGEGEKKGLVSHDLHDKYSIGDTIELSAPAGDFKVESEKGKTLLLLSSGAGVTPMFAMLEDEAYKGRNVHFVHVNEAEKDVPFKEEVDALNAMNENVEVTYHLKEKDGYLTSNELSNWINEDVDIYLCGGITFMDTIFDELEKLNIGQADVHFEPFGPKMSITNV
ncbi:globin domain-containing protein [Mammaliicoccus sciuri]|jgi:nitric oxide dioxygenase|uniref:globin domain-containing protein n=1 Tax=Mammaliicoccus sciuri TaxID=1296 RepID=UPI000807650F|nr:globin domain-containing protein [Mammaliicoccus sciuri]MBO1208959.1 flavohemoprotein [Mammaliicoccus sciuri]MCD5140308.1 flavohemoprotein [Mammaliicoccus sciuri]MCD8762567.1 flavohemoprotein [Mammaliicoccus sciuri]MCD8770230.1 flavohemoprotein [Mammaliicoccus sciuri]MCD8883948.1 flavohemoprotein [Mammaliicoccus sciuri]